MADWSTPEKKMHPATEKKMHPATLRTSKSRKAVCGHDTARRRRGKTRLRGRLALLARNQPDKVRSLSESAASCAALPPATSCRRQGRFTRPIHLAEPFSRQ